MKSRIIRIASRKSELALWQANWVKAELENLGYQAELVLIETQGDKNYQPFANLQGQGFFTKAIQDAVLQERADVAVHSFKDLPTMQAAGLELAAITERADPRDVLLIRPDYFEENDNLKLKANAVVGTSAARRKMQIISLRPDLKTKELRGNVPSRIKKLKDGQYDAIVLAAAGLARIKPNTDGLILQYLEPKLMVPAPAQGALALEIRRDDELATVVNNLNHIPSQKAISAERGLMAMLMGGCQLALGAHAFKAEKGLKMLAWYEGKMVTKENLNPEYLANLVYDALGRPDPNQEGK